MYYKLLNLVGKEKIQILRFLYIFAKQLIADVYNNLVYCKLLTNTKHLRLEILLVIGKRINIS